MATRVITMLTDDLDGSEAAETIRFSLDGKEYEIDLNIENAQAMRQALLPYKDAARRATAQRTSAPAPRRTTVGPTQSDVRRWAKSQGMPVSKYGRVSDDLISQYKAAHPEL